MKSEYIVGLGCRRGTSCAEISDAIESVLKSAGNIRSDDLGLIATCSIKADEIGLLQYAEKKRLKLVFFTAEELSTVDVPSPSEKVKSRIGSLSVCEASAIAAGGKIISPKTIFGGMVTVSLAERPHQKGAVFAVGIGSGDPGQITEKAKSVIRNSDLVVGYSRYLEQIAPLIKGKKTFASGMTHEIERCKAALDAALEGKTVSVVCSGDAGIYGMAGLLLELAEERADFKLIRIETIPGITAATQAAAALGAALMNDFAVISLSDLLTPKATIMKRIRLLAGSDMVLAIYNPRSHGRKHLLSYAVKHIKKVRGRETKFGVVKNAGRIDELSVCGTLDHFPEEFIDMSSLVIIGNSQTILKGGRLYTRRGYRIRQPIAKLTVAARS